ncbi:hypothetical protein V1498_04950 [Peribacillus sp. SCS-26]
MGQILPPLLIDDVRLEVFFILMHTNKQAEPFISLVFIVYD